MMSNIDMKQIEMREKKEFSANATVAYFATVQNQVGRRLQPNS